MCLHCEPIAATRTADSATYNIAAFVYGEGLGQKSFCKKYKLTNNVENFLNMVGAGVHL